VTLLVTEGGTGIERAIATELAMLECWRHGGISCESLLHSHETCVETAAEMNLQTRNGGGKGVVGPSTSIRKEEYVS